MGWKIGDWQDFKGGQIHHVTKKCLQVLHDNGFNMEVDFVAQKKKVFYEKPESGFFEILKEYEQEQGVAILLDGLIHGAVVLQAHKNGCVIDVRLFLRGPQDSQEKVELFKELIASWVKADTLSFTERFFRLPKIDEDIADRYLDNPLKQVLRKTFGFHFSYKLIASSSNNSAESNVIREALYKTIACS